MMWWMPDRRNFVPDNDILEGVGKLKQYYFLQLQRLSLALLTRAEKPPFPGKAVSRELSQILVNFLHRLEFSSSSLFSMQHGIHELQRTFLKLKGFLDFEEHYRLETSTPPAIPHLMGSFTWDPVICQSLFQAGVPVWLVCPWSALPSIRVRKLVTITQPQTLLPLTPCSRPGCLALYHGPADRIEKYIALQASVLEFLKFPNPFGLSRSQPIVTPPPLAEPSKRQERSTRYSPCKPKMLGRF
jgi:hypothetical protein